MATPPTPITPQAVTAVTAEHRDRLVALRDSLTTAVDEAGPRDLAPLAGQLRRVLADLAALPDASEASDVDDLAASRARRRSKAAAS